MTTHCSFCDRGLAEVCRLIEGPGVWICDRCVVAAGEGGFEAPALVCDFCREANPRGYRTASAAICAPCAELSAEILDEAGAAGGLPRAIIHRERN